MCGRKGIYKRHDKSRSRQKKNRLRDVSWATTPTEQGKPYAPKNKIRK